ncbi:reverse transcriptase domain-containing protein, partial [Tanacetum coccineum]
MFKYGETQSEAVRLLMFPLPLSDKAKTWFNELNEESITSWEQIRRSFIRRFFSPSIFDHLLLEIRSFSKNVCESLTDAWLRLKNMLQKCHGHGLTKGAIIQIFYPGLEEPTQEILNGTAGGIFLYKTPNQSFQLLEDKVLFEVDWSNKLQMKPTQKSVGFADGSNINDVNSRIMKKLEALTIKIDSQITSIKEELQDMRNKYYDLRGNHASKNRMNDDTLMCECHEANYVQSEGYQNQNSHDSYSHQSHHDSNDSEKSITELNNDGGMISKISKADEKQIKPWSLPELLLQLSNDSRTIAEILKQRDEKRIECKQAANLAVQKEQEEQAAQSFTLYWNFPIIDNDDKEYTIQYREYLERSSKAITPDLPTEEPDNSLSMGDEHLNTIPETESDEVIKSSVKNLIPIPSESEETSIVYSSKIDSLLEEFTGELAPILPGNHEADFDPEEDIRLDNQLFYDDTSSDDNSFEDINYVEVSPPNFELVSLEEVKDFDTEDREIDTDILLTIKDDILCEKLWNINLLIAKIESLNDNPTPDFVLKSPFSFPIPVKDSDFFLEKTETFLSLPELETFRFDIEEKNSDSTTVHADISLPEYDSFHFEIEPDQGELTRVVVEDIYDNLTRELYVNVPNILPTLPTLVDRLYLFLTYVIRLFLPYFTYPVKSPFPFSFGSEDTIFDPGISAYSFYSLDPVA